MSIRRSGRIEQGLTLFEIVPPHANAVNGTVVKFLDIRDIGDGAPRRVAVVTSKDKTPHLSLLARTATVIGQDASDDVLRTAAEPLARPALRCIGRDRF